MKKNVTYIDAIEFETRIQASGLATTPQKGFIKVHGPKGRQVYVANTKRVGRVDLSGFTMEDLGVRDLGGESFGAVHQQMDFSRTRDEILECFERVLAHMKSLPEAEPVKRSNPVKGNVVSSSPAKPMDPEAHKALIRKFAAERGLKISPLSPAAEAPVILAADGSPAR